MQLINGLHFNNIRGDIYGGLTAAVVALPLALAMGVSSGAGPIAGIYGAIFVGFFAALFGGTPAQVSGPTGPMTVVMAAIFTQYTSMFPDNPLYGAQLAFTIVIMGGLFQILFGILRIGKYIQFVPHPVVSGFMSGIGVIIILLQLPPLLGFPSQTGPMSSIDALPMAFNNLIFPALALGVMTIAIVYLLPKPISKLIPSPLVALIVGTLIYILFLQETAITILGTIPTGLPDPQMPVFELSLLPLMIMSALTLAALGTIDSLLTSLVADNVTHTYHKSDKELIGQGIGNTISGFFGGLPGAGATMRTVVNIKAGGSTPISGSLHALVLLAIVLGAGTLASSIPHAVLAGILIKVGTDIIDWDYLKHLKTAPKAGISMMIVVLTMTVFIDLIMAIAVGMTMAGMIFMKRMADLQLEGMKTNRDQNANLAFNDEEEKIVSAAGEKLLLVHPQGPMSFGAAKGMAKAFSEIENYDVVIFDFTDVPQIDYTSSRALLDTVNDVRSKNRDALISGACENVKITLEDHDIIRALSDNGFHPNRPSALQHASEIINH